MGIRIVTDKSLIRVDAWDFPIEELEYLLEEHDDETFVLCDGRLWETDMDEDMGELNDDLLDAIKADAAWVLNLEPYSDEWFELMDI